MNKNNKKIKILVCYHKKSKLLKDNVLVPIHAGRSIADLKYKNGKLRASEYKWLKKNLLPDNTGENISDLNSTINEMTVLYWGWKNYDKLGNPDYIGLYHYRRIFDIKNSDLLDILQNCYFIQRKPDKIPKANSLYEQWHNLDLDWASNEYLECALNACKSYNKDLGQDIEKFFKSEPKVCWCNMFIMPREEFFKYCEFIFPLIFYLNESLPKRNDRAFGMFCERLTAYYLHKLSQRANGYNAKSIFLKKDVNLLQKVFSIKNEGNHNVVRILGSKLSIRRKVAKD